MKQVSRKINVDVRGAQSEDDLHAANDLMAKTQLPNYWDSIGWLESAGPAWHGSRKELTRMAFVGESLAGGLRILPMVLRIGKARLKAGGIGWVSTAPDFRNRGVCAALMRDAHTFMREQGCFLSLLYGVPNLYHRYGYATMLPEYSIVVERPALAAVPATDNRVRPITPEDIPALARMHEMHEAEASCSIVRNSAFYTSQFRSNMPKTPYWADWPKAKALLNRKGAIVAYMMPQASSTELHIKEFGVTDRDSYTTLLHAAMIMAREAGLNVVRFHAPPYHPFARYLEKFDSTHQARHFENREGMIAILDIDACLNSMLPEWKKRIHQAGIDDHIAEHTLVVDGRGYRIMFDGKQLTFRNGLGRNRTPASPQELVQLISGHAYPEDFLAEKAPYLKGEGVRFFTALFPKRAPFVWPIDHF